MPFGEPWHVLLSEQLFANVGISVLRSDGVCDDAGGGGDELLHASASEASDATRAEREGNVMGGCGFL